MRHTILLCSIILESVHHTNEILPFSLAPINAMAKLTQFFCRPMSVLEVLGVSLSVLYRGQVPRLSGQPQPMHSRGRIE